MERPIEQAHQEFRDNLDRLAKRAMGMFLSASYLSPASVIAQGARIAEQCKNEDLDPSFLHELLKDNNGMLLFMIQDKANKVHKRKRKTRKINQNDVLSIIKFDFTMAANLMVLDQSELNNIYGSMYEELSSMDIVEREKILRDRIDGLLRQH